MFKKLKKLFMILLVIPAMFMFGACKNNDGSGNNGGTPPVVTPPSQGGGDDTTPDTPGGDDTAPSQQSYSVSFDYALPEGYELIENSTITKNLGESVALPTIADENLNKYFLGWYDKSNDEKIETETISGTSGQTIAVVAKWNEATLKNYYYTPGLTFAVGTDLDEETIAVVDSYDGASSNVILPKFYEFEASVILPVRMISQNCFNNADVETVKHSSNGLIIGKNAFANTKLTSFDFSDVLYIDEYAFYGSKLESVELGALVQGVGDFAFYDCEELETVDFSNASLVTKIPTSCFEDCKKLAGVEVSNAITTVASFAFKNCSSLENLEFLQNVSTIEQGAFQDCLGVKSVVIYNNTTSLSSSAFTGCNVEDLSVYNFFDDSDMSRFSSTFGDLALAENLTLLGDNILQIRDYYFADLTTLKSISISNSVTKIGQYAFQACVNLSEIQFSENLDASSFNKNAIEDTAWYKNLTEVTYIGKSLFYVPASVSGALEIVSGTENIVAEAFKKNTNITAVTIPASLKVVSVGAFEGCTSLETVVFKQGSQVSQIASKAFRNCTALNSINLEICENLTTLAMSAFEKAGTNIAEFKLPKNIESIDKTSFYGAMIASYAIDNSASHFAVEDGVLFDKEKTTLYSYPALKQDDVYQVPSTVTLIKNYAFYNNAYIEVVQLQSAVKFEQIGGISYSFSGMYQQIYLLADNQSVTINSILSNVKLCHKITETDIEYTIDNSGEEEVISFAVKDESTYEFVSGAYFIKVNVDGEDKWFLLDISVSGETITINSVNDISSYFA